MKVKSKMNNTAKCVNCGKDNQSKPVVWVFVEYPLGIGLCYDCDNGTNKRKFWDKKTELISKGAAVSDKPAVTKLTEEEILENAKGPVRKKVDVEKNRAKDKMTDLMVKSALLNQDKNVTHPAPMGVPLSRGEVIKMHTPKNDDTLFVRGIKKEIKENLTTKGMNTKIIWVVSTEDPSAEDLKSIKQFVDHFGAGDEDIDIKTGKHRILVKNDKPEEETARQTSQPPTKAAGKPLSKYMQKKLNGNLPKKDKKAKKFKSGAKLGAVNNTDFPSVNGRQPWVRCTGCGEYKNINWDRKCEDIHIGLCSGCANDADKELNYENKVDKLGGVRAA